MKSVIALMTILSSVVATAAVYELQLTVTTTAAKEANLKATSNYCEEEGKVAYRTTTKMKIKGLLWGDECGFGSGMVLWNETLKEQYGSDSEFAWEFLNRIGKDGKEAEGLWKANLTWDSGEEAAYLYGAATGKVKGSDEISLSGNFAGYMYAGQVTIKEKTPGCAACGGGIISEVLDAVGWGVCDCAEADERTAAHGTWTLKYNASASKKYAEGGDIAAAYKFPKYVEP